MVHQTVTYLLHAGAAHRHKQHVLNEVVPSFVPGDEDRQVNRAPAPNGCFGGRPHVDPVGIGVGVKLATTSAALLSLSLCAVPL